MADQLLGGIIINEILVDPNGANNFDTDGNATASAVDEYIELYNASGGPIDIGGLQMWDQGVGNWFTFPSGTILQAGAHAMVMSGVQAGGNLPTSANPDDMFFDAGRGSALINNGGDNVVVYDPANDQYISATYNGDALDDPTATYSGFSATATQVGAGEDFGTDIDGFSLQRGPDGTNTFVNNEAPTPGTTNVCFTHGTLIGTAGGPKLIEHLRPSDLLRTKDNGLQPIKWIWARKVSAADILNNPMLNAIRISKDALGAGTPSRDISLSRQHRVLIASKIAQRMFETAEVLSPTKDLIEIKGIKPAPLGHDITYYHILMDRHEILFADGLATESLYLGTQAMQALEPAAKAELALIFGPNWAAFIGAPPARTLISGKRAQRLAFRHQKNNKPLCVTLEP